MECGAAWVLGGVWWSLRFWVGLLIFAQTAWRKPALKPIDPARVHGAHPVDVVHIGPQLERLPNPSQQLRRGYRGERDQECGGQGRESWRHVSTPCLKGSKRMPAVDNPNHRPVYYSLQRRVFPVGQHAARFPERWPAVRC